MKLSINTHRSIRRDISSTRLAAIIITIITLIVVYWGANAMFKPVDVVILKKDVPTGQILEKSDLSVVKVALRDRHEQAFTSIDEVLKTDKTPARYASTDLYKGQQLIVPQTTFDPSGLKSALGGITVNETVLQLNEDQAYWPGILRDSDFVMIEAVLADSNYIEELGIGKVIQDVPITDKSGVLHVSQPTKQNRQLLITSIDTAKKTLLAIHNADMVYLRPVHPKLAN